MASFKDLPIDHPLKTTVLAVAYMFGGIGCSCGNSD